MPPKYTISSLKHSVDSRTWDKAVGLYYSGKVTDVSDDVYGYSAVVVGTKPYKVYVSASHPDRGTCDCYMGQNDYYCKHMVALGIHAVMGGKPLGAEDTEVFDRPQSSGRLGVLSAAELKEVKSSVTEAMRHIKPYNGPSGIWFQYQDSLGQGCSLLTEIVCKLPVGRQTADLLVDVVIRADRKLLNGVDDSDGTVGDFILGTVQVIEEYVKLDASCIGALERLIGIETCFGWENGLVKLLKES